MNKELLKLRKQIDSIDNKLLDILTERVEVTEEIFNLKKEIRLNSKDNIRETEIIDRLYSKSEGKLSYDYLEKIYSIIFKGVDRDVIDYMPLDKSWYIRLCILSLINNDDTVIKFLEGKELCDDLKCTVNAVKNFHQQTIDVGESATLLRFLKFYCWYNNINKDFTMGPMLRKRNICDNPDIVNWSVKELLKLDYGTSQWVSAFMLVKKDMNLFHPEGTNYNKKINLTREALNVWYSSKDRTKVIIDKTIRKQVRYYLGHDIKFNVSTGEDYCFARAFNLMTKEEGIKKWPQLVNHESNRIEEMEKQLHKKTITSTDHRVVQALALKAKKNNRLNVNILYPKCVSKSWPKFWSFYDAT
jgi:chorismate mutase|tara:strand:- start:148 stop:1221 length:1074 start_codon:yes stop_codon:yes gene_type:complete